MGGSPRMRKFERIKGQSLSGEAEDAIRAAIFEGRVRPEERLTIETIAEELGISRTPVREALRALEADGLIDILPRRGAVVRRFDKAELDDRYSVRAIIEGYAGELAHANKGPELAEFLAENCRLLDAAIARTDPQDLGQVRELVQINRDFHGAILEASGSQSASRALSTLSMPIGFILYYWRSPERQRAALEFHREIVKAFGGDDGKEVRRLLEAHLMEARDFLMAGQEKRDNVPGYASLSA
jgi:GntR family transcriptional regulator of vanillate catabolism